MRRAILILVGVAVLIGVGVYLFAPGKPRMFALGSRTAEFSFVIRDSESKEPIAGATIKIWDDASKQEERKLLGELTTDASGVAKYVRKNQSVEDVIGIRASYKLQGVRRHPSGIGTFVDRFWCLLDLSAKGYAPLENESLVNYEYDDNGYDKAARLHRFEFVLEMQRK